jgi:hypothetical protein
MRRLLRILWALAPGLISACDGVSSDPGLSAQLRVLDAQFVPGKLPAAGKGPPIVSAHIPHNQILPGLRTERLSGTLDPAANAVLIGLLHDNGYWIVTAGVPTLDEPALPSFGAELSFSPHVNRDPLELCLLAVDRQGRVGPATTVTLHPDDLATSAELLVRLRWDSDADLDLHVVDPSGVEIWAGNINSYVAPPPGAPAADAGAWLSSGILDFDSNASCVIDGRREENVSWSGPPPSGRYTVRVATASLCSAASARYEVEAWLHGRSIARATGISLPSESRDGAQRGDGTLATQFRVP